MASVLITLQSIFEIVLKGPPTVEIFRIVVQSQLENGLKKSRDSRSV